MKRIETYRRLAELCEREASSARDPGERRQFTVLSRAIRTWAVDDEPVETGSEPTARPASDGACA
ncbi:MAG: hypothetical protein DI570_04060 [Phenylobacterium zucineum]|nr:MAG: hypothetical protein DI570_04060 [Phenylobacterium zucineum]